MTPSPRRRPPPPRWRSFFSNSGPNLARVELRRNNILLDTQTLRINSNHDTCSASTSPTNLPDTASSYEYEVRVQELPGEVNLQNNRFLLPRRHQKRQTLHPSSLMTARALGIPRLPRRLPLLPGDRCRLKLQTVLLHPASYRRHLAPLTPVSLSRQPPTRSPPSLPETREEWSAFDIIILGDIPPDTLTNDQQQFIASPPVRDTSAPPSSPSPANATCPNNSGQHPPRRHPPRHPHPAMDSANSSTTTPT